MASMRQGSSLLFHDFNVFAGSPAPLKGTGEHSIGRKDVTVCEAKGVVVAPGLALLRYGPEFEHLSITVRPAALTSKLSAILGDLRLGPLEFDPVVNGGDPESRRLNRLIRFVAAEADNSWPLPPIIQAELQQTMMVSLLLQSYANDLYSALLRGEPIATAPWQLRSRRRFIKSHSAQPITAEALAVATNVSVRSLYYAFKAGRGCSPIGFRQACSARPRATDIVEFGAGHISDRCCPRLRIWQCRPFCRGLSPRLWRAAVRNFEARQRPLSSPSRIAQQIANGRPHLDGPTADGSDCAQQRTRFPCSRWRQQQTAPVTPRFLRFRISSIALPSSASGLPSYWAIFAKARRQRMSASALAIS